MIYLPAVFLSFIPLLLLLLLLLLFPLLLFLLSPTLADFPSRVATSTRKVIQ